MKVRMVNLLLFPSKPNPGINHFTQSEERAGGESGMNELVMNFLVYTTFEL
jgi:hypothetical protein